MLHHVISKIKSPRLTGTKGILAAVPLTFMAALLILLTILRTGDPRITWLIAGAGIIITGAILWPRIKRHPIQAILKLPWNNPYLLFWLTAFVIIPVLIGIPVAFHMKHIVANTTPIQEARPWREGLPAYGWWQKPPSHEMEQALIDTASTFGINYQRVHSPDDANLRIWLDSLALQCKWLTAQAYVSWEPQPHPCGSQAGEIHVCRFTTPFKDRQLSDRSIIAHEAGHIFAALTHFGDGLMAKGGGDHADWFTDDDIKKMRTHIKDFRDSVKDECQEPPPTS